MRSLSSKVLCLIICGLLNAFTQMQAEEWVRGAVAVTSVRGDVLVEEAGGASLQLHQGDDSLPRLASGLLQVSTQPENALFLQTSNQISIYNEGVGFFAIERFEQDIGVSMDQGKSRMILNFRQGLLGVDNRILSENSQIIVETPLGRLSTKRAWWVMAIIYDERSRIYNFSIECADGVVRFNDQRGHTYILRNGQRLSGAGASARASIEVGEMSEDGSEFFEEFAKMKEEGEAFELTTDTFRPKMKALNYSNQGKGTRAEAVQPINLSKPPVLIEYAPRATSVTPYRAVIRRPSAYEADMF